MCIRIIISIFLIFGYTVGQVASYCDYVSGFTTNSSSAYFYSYTTGNDQEICDSLMLQSLEVLNANYASAGIEFVLHPDYPNMLHATDPGFDGFFERATGGTAGSPSANALKEHYNIPNAFNIYIVDFVNTRDGTSGIATYPWDIDSNPPGAFFKHGFLPGDKDGNDSAEYDRTLMHEIGHYFGLLHINGTWYLKEGNRPRDRAYRADCNEHGDTICDTPAEPGESGDAWDKCIYHGYGGDYNAVDSTLRIGGYNINGGLVYGWNGKHGEEYETYNYNYCEEWEIEDPYGLNDHCYTYTNYDNVGDFFGTLGVNSEECNSDDPSYATECHIDNYLHLPIGHNFMRAGSSPYNDCGLSPIIDSDYYDETKSGFTKDQNDNMRYFIEHCYTGCNDIAACNFDTTSSHLLRNGPSSCEYSWETETDCENDCILPSDQISRSKQIESSTLSYINSFTNNDLDCATDELYGNLTGEQWTKLVKIRHKVKELIKMNLHRKQVDTTTLYIPVVFHNIYKLESLSSNSITYPEKFGINQIYPNPFNPTTTINYALPINEDAHISIYNINGRLITTLINEFQTAGYHSVVWDASNFSSGIYIIQIASEKLTKSRKIVLIK